VYAVKGFASGEALLEQLSRSAPPDLILLDWQLPGVSGLEVCRSIRERFDDSALPILMLTIRGARADFIQGLAAGANDYLAKPVDELELMARVRTFLSMRQRTQELRERESLLATTLTSIGDAVITTNARSNITFLNPAAETLTGWSKNDATGRPLSEILRLLHEHTRAKVKSSAEKVLRDGVAAGLPHRRLLVRKDGSEMPIDDSAAPIRGQNGALVGAVLVLRDQTAARKQENELRTFRALIDASSDFIAFGKPEGSLQYLNPAGQKLSGVAGQEAARRTNTVDYFTPETAGQSMSAMFPLVLSGGYFRGETVFRNLQTNESVPMLQDTFGIRDENGELQTVATISRDLRERKRGEAALEALLLREQTARAEGLRERERLYALLMQAPAPIAILEGPQHVFTFANPAYRALVNGRDIVDKPLHEALPDVREQGFDKLLDQVMATGEKVFGKEVPIKLEHHVGDERLILNFVYVPKRNAEGQIDGVLMSGSDVTEQVRARWNVEALAGELRQSEERLRRVVEASGAGLWDLDAKDGRIKADARFLTLMGAPQEMPMTLQSALDGLHESDRDRVAKAVAGAMAGENGGRYSMEFRSVRASDGVVRWLESRGQVVFDGEGKAKNLPGAMTDISARKAAEAEREQALNRVVEVLETMGDIFFALDPQWRLALVNRNYEKWTRTRREDTVGRIFWELYPDAAEPDSVYWREYHRCSQERVAVQFLDFYAPLGFWADVRAHPTADGGIAVFIRDVSAEKRAEESLRRQTEFEQQLIGIVSHDLRNPLNAILLSSSILKRGEELSDKDLNGVVRIQNAAERAARMVSDLLDFTQARLGGGIPIEPRPADLRALTRNVIDEVEAAYPGRELVVSHEGETQGYWDPDRLAQVLQNLATNALKYSPEESVVRVTTSGQDGWTSLSVHNSGAPISAQLLPGIFEPLRRGTSDVDHSGRSIGLGLYIVKQVVDAHKGTVEVRSDDASGTTFTVRLPRGG